MRLSTKGRYAMVAMTALAMTSNDSYTNLLNISKQQKISITYLEQLFMKLKKAKLITASRGPSGGYKLAKPPEQIRILRILEAVDEPMNALETGAGVSGGSSGTKAQSLANRLWEGLSAQVYVYLHGIRLSDIINNDLAPCPAVPDLLNIYDADEDKDLS